ncbi:hypothetical protein CDIK_1361 [Cucumispora dikerogammari]|nr:hypothetical protein CDIK_1361 [Cucumispora dikerogammari]
MDEEIQVNDFLKERNDEINELIDSLDRKKKTMEFQRLPFYKRRRTRSLIKKKRPKNKTTEKNNWLPMHVYFAKRFKMMKLNGWKVPLLRAQKSEKFIYKSAHRGFLWDEGFMKLNIFKKDELISKNLIITRENVFVDCVLENQPVSYCKINNEMILFQSPLATDYYVFTIFYGKRLIPGKYSICEFKNMFSAEELNGNKISQSRQYLKQEYIGNFEMNEVTFHVIPTEYSFKYKIIFDIKLMKTVFNLFLKQGYIPISVNELFRISIESKIVLNLDKIDTDFYEKFEKAVYGDEQLKYERTPAGKKKNYKTVGFSEPFFLNIKYSQTKIFELKKGSFERGGLVYKMGEECGIVIRGSYCFSSGKERGIVGIRNFDENSSYTLKSIKNGKTYDLSPVN